MDDIVIELHILETLLSVSSYDALYSPVQFSTPDSMTLFFRHISGILVGLCINWLLLYLIHMGMTVENYWTLLTLCVVNR